MDNQHAVDSSYMMKVSATAFTSAMITQLILSIGAAIWTGLLDMNIDTSVAVLVEGVPLILVVMGIGDLIKAVVFELRGVVAAIRGSEKKTE